MVQWNLTEIRQKIRQITGRYSPDELSNEQLDVYINKYFQYTFPAEMKLDRFHSYYEFVTTPNQQTYDYPSGYVNFEPEAFVDGRSILWYQNPSIFDSNQPENFVRVSLGTGDGATTNFTTTTQSTPILPNTLVAGDSVETFQDTTTVYTANNVSITGSQGGTAIINYSTGSISVTFNTAPVDGDNISLAYVNFISGRPTSVLLYNNQLKFYPVPDQAYRFKASAYSNVLVTTAAGTNTTDFSNSTDRPLLDEWGPTIAYGTGRDIVSDYGEMESYAQLTALYKEQLAYIARRTHNNLLNTRAMPNF